MVTCCLPRFPTTALPPSLLWRKKKRRKLAGGQGAPELPGAAPGVLRSRALCSAAMLRSHAPCPAAMRLWTPGMEPKGSECCACATPGLDSGVSSRGCQHRCGGGSSELAGSLRVLTVCTEVPCLQLLVQLCLRLGSCGILALRLLCSPSTSMHRKNP